MEEVVRATHKKAIECFQESEKPLSKKLSNLSTWWLDRR